MGLNVKLSDGEHFEPLDGSNKRVRILLRSVDGTLPTVSLRPGYGELEVSWTYTGMPYSVGHAELDILEPDEGC